MTSLARFVSELMLKEWLVTRLEAPLVLPGGKASTGDWLAELASRKLGKFSAEIGGVEREPFDGMMLVMVDLASLREVDEAFEAELDVRD